MAAVRDLYEILGVQRDASPDDIKRAYRQLARELHPDVSGKADAEERFKEVVGAYEILSDPEKRQRYDAFGRDGGPQGFPFTDVQDIFDMFFGGGFGQGTRRGGRRSRTQRGEDLRTTVSLAFSEAAFGARPELQLERMVVCNRCLGNGAEPGTAPIACRTCGGSGELQSVRRSVFGTLMTASPCATCGGTGQEIPDACEKCMGQGRIRQPSAVAVEIPAGVSDGMELRVTGSGHAGVSGGPAGDLFVHLEVETAERFERRGQDLFAVLDISVTHAALGGDVQIEGIEGSETVRIDAGTDSGTIVRLRGKGIPNLNRRGRGDLAVTLHVVTPRGLAPEERALLSVLSA